MNRVIPDRDALAAAGFSRPDEARRALVRLTATPRGGVALGTSQLLQALSQLPDPDRALVSLERLLSAGGSERILARLNRQPRALEHLLTICAGSHFLGETILQRSQNLDMVLDLGRLSPPPTRQELDAALGGALGEPGREEPRGEWRRKVRDFQRSELLRIGASDLLGLLDLPSVTQQLSQLADSILQACLDRSARQESIEPDDFVVFALGKLGGEEINYSSDIDLIFCSRGNAPSFWPLGRRLIDALARGYSGTALYRVDMRLRPWGRDGALVSSLDSYFNYLSSVAGLAEKQALLKARVVAGHRALGEGFLERARPLLFTASADEVRSHVADLKRRIEGQLKDHGRAWGEVKSGAGSIRDVEFATQNLQLIHGRENPRVLHGNTLMALTRLNEEGFLATPDYRALVEGYVFLRGVEHYLQLVHNLKVHSLPRETQALLQLAHRLGFAGDQADERFLLRYGQHERNVRRVFERLLSGPMGADPDPPVASPALAELGDPLLGALGAMPAAYRETFSQDQIAAHARMASRLGRENLVEVEVEASEGLQWRVLIVGYDFLGELSLICGLLFVHGFNILSGHVFSGQTWPEDEADDDRAAAPSSPPRLARRACIVDAFTLRRPSPPPADVWRSFEGELEELLEKLREHGAEVAQAELAKRIALTMTGGSGVPAALRPITIRFDNAVSARDTRIEIQAPDTPGFLYEFTNALALDRISVSYMTVTSQGDRVYDTLFVTDAQGRKITSTERLDQLRVATVLTKHFTHLLPRSPNPSSALLHFRQFLRDLFRRSAWEEIQSLERPEVLNSLALLLGVSDFLWEDFLRLQHENLFPIISNVEALTRRRSRTELEEELAARLAPYDPQVRGTLSSEESWDRIRVVLNAFKDRQMFRIDMRQILALCTDFEAFSRELTELAEVVLERAYRLVMQWLEEEPFQASHSPGGERIRSCLCALGKCGGREMGYASDVELVLIYDSVETAARDSGHLPSELFNRGVDKIRGLIRSRSKGIFEIDLRLRPYGSAGPRAVSLDAFERYYGPGGEAWLYERQALVKLRPIAGDRAFGGRVVELRDQLIYQGPFLDMAAGKALRERQVRHLVTPGTVNAKFSPGGLVDTEYMVQLLQLKHGGSHASLRTTNTLEAITAARELKVLDEGDAGAIEETYRFLRRLIDALRIVRGNAKDLTVPDPSSDEFLFLARRLEIPETSLVSELYRHLARSVALSRRLQE